MAERGTYRAIHTVIVDSEDLRTRRRRGFQFKTVRWHRQLRASVFSRDGFRCVYCGARAEPPDDYDGRYSLVCVDDDGHNHLHLDHVVPWSLGGGDDPENVVTACHRCNSSKRDTVHG